MNILTDVPSSNGLFVQLIVIVVLIIINAFFAASELAILSANPTKIKMLADQKNKKAILVQKLQSDETKFLSTIQVGITLAGFFSSATAAVSISERLEDYFNFPYGETVSLIIVTLILSYFTLVLGELFPKRIALRSPEKIAMAFAGSINVIRILFKPIVFLLSKSCNLLAIIFRLNTDDEEVVTEEEVKALIEAGVEDGTIEEDEEEMINAIFTFSDLTVKNVMTYRLDIFMINIDDDIDIIINNIKIQKYSRVPVYENHKDNIIGILNTKDLFLNENIDLNKKGLTKEVLVSMLREPLFVFENAKINDMLDVFKKNHTHSALVCDEVGTIVGLVTLEDIVEEITGNIYDEYDEVEEEIHKNSDNEYIILGHINIQDLNKALEVELELSLNLEYTTLAGFIIHKLQYIPEVNEELIIDNIKLTILEVVENKISKIKLEFINNQLEIDE